MSVLLNTELTNVNAEAADRDQVLTAMAHQLDESGVTNAGFLEALLKREENYPTGLPISGGVAIPHTDPQYVFGQMGGSEEDEVSVSVVILMALSNADDHLSMLQNIVKSIQDGDLMKTIRNAAEPEEIVSLVRAMIPSDTEAA